MTGTYIVTTLNDYGEGSLREGIKYANLNENTVVTFAVSGIIILNSDLPIIKNKTTITNNLTVEGIPSIVIDGNKKYTLLQVCKASGCVFNGLCLINSSDSGILLKYSNLNKIDNCWIGIDTSSTKSPNRKNGITIIESNSNIIGSNDGLVQTYFSNVISGNKHYGVYLLKSKFNKIQNNIIGLNNLCSTTPFGNGKDGIKLELSSKNEIGGKIFIDINGATNDPTGNKDSVSPVFVRPLLGNIISGNKCNGITVLESSTNYISGNFIGTDNTGLIMCGNGENGIYIVKSEFTNMIGCDFDNLPFVFYNVICGNKVGIFNYLSQYSLIQANFVGIGADNFTAIPNGVGVLDKDSDGLIVGGIIPLGNVIAGNLSNGFHITGNSNGFMSVNSFIGLKAFGIALPNGENGMLIDGNVTNVKLNTNVISGNTGNGIKISGNASDILLTSNMIGLTTDGLSALPNGENGIDISGNVNGVATFVSVTSVIPRNIVSGNLKYGVVLGGKSYNNSVVQTSIGLDVFSLVPIQNNLGGLLITDKSNNNIIGTDYDVTNINYFYDRDNFSVKLTKKTYKNVGINNFININIANVTLPHNYNIINESDENIVYANNLPMN